MEKNIVEGFIDGRIPRDALVNGNKYEREWLWNYDCIVSGRKQSIRRRQQFNNAVVDKNAETQDK